MVRRPVVGLQDWFRLRWQGVDADGAFCAVASDLGEADVMQLAIAVNSIEAGDCQAAAEYLRRAGQIRNLQ